MTTPSDNTGLSQRDILLRLDTKVDTLVESVGTIKANADNSLKVQEDHETRIRALERFRFAIPSTAILSLLISAALLVFYLSQGVHH